MPVVELMIAGTRSEPADITIPQHLRAKIALPDATAPFYRLIAAP